MIGSLLGISALIVIAAAVWMAVESRRPSGEPVTFRSILTIYFYVVAAISLLAVVLGGAQAIKAGLAQVYGYDFSYPMPYTAEPMSASPNINQPVNDQKVVQQQHDQTTQELQSDAFDGISLLMVGLLFLAVHGWGWRTMEKGRPVGDSRLFQAYTLLQMALYGIMTLVSLPLAISQTLRWTWHMQQNYSSMAPGQSVGMTIMAVPVWLFWVWLTFTLLRKHPISTK